MNLRVTSVFLIAVMLTLSGCGSMSFIEEKKINYKSANKVPPLEIPPDLTSSTPDDRYAVPDVNNTRGAATFSAYNKDRTTQPQTASSNLLPQVPDVQIERAGSQRWLAVNAPPEKVWPVVREFWQELGFVIKTEKPEAGVLETDWAENRAKIPSDPIRNVLGKFLDGAYSTAERDKFRTRLEAGKSPNTTEVYISHRRMYEVVTDNLKGQTVWEPQPADPNLEAEMLRRLMVRFGAEESRAAAQLANKATSEERAKLTQGADGAENLALTEPFDRAWRRVGLALDRIGFTVEDRDRSKGVYYVRYVDPDVDNAKESKGWLSKLAFWKSNKPAPREEYRIKVAESGETSLVSVQSKEGSTAKSPTQRRILSLLYNQLK